MEEYFVFYLGVIHSIMLKIKTDKLYLLSTYGVSTFGVAPSLGILLQDHKRQH